MRYAYDVRYELHRMGSTEFSNQVKAKPLSEYIYADLWNTLHGWELGIESSVLPVLIGPSVDESTAAAAEAADVRINLWRYNEDDGQFYFDLPEHPSHQDNTPIPEWAKKINQEIAIICEYDTELIFNTKIARLFGAQEKWPLGLPCTLPFVTGVNPNGQW